MFKKTGSFVARNSGQPGKTPGCITFATNLSETRHGIDRPEIAEEYFTCTESAR